MGHVCAGPFASSDEWDWYNANYINEDSYWYADNEDAWVEITDTRLWDYNAGGAF